MTAPEIQEWLSASTQISGKGVIACTMRQGNFVGRCQVRSYPTTLDDDVQQARDGALRNLMALKNAADRRGIKP